MQIYLVGGAVRDKLLGIENHDKDYVVVGATVEKMLSLGFTQVGHDFPVFFHHLKKRCQHFVKSVCYTNRECRSNPEGL